MPRRATCKVPRLYKAAAKVLNVMKNENEVLEKLVEQYEKRTNAKALAALVSKAIKNEALLDSIIKKSYILVNESKEDPWLFRVLIAELLLGKQRLPIGSNTIQTVLSYEPKLRTLLLKAQGKYEVKHTRYKVEDSDSNESESTKTEKFKTAEFNDKNTDMKTQKRKEDVQTSMEEDTLQYKSKKLKKSKKKKKGNKEVVPEVNDNIMNESVDIEQLPKFLCGEQQDYIKLEESNDESTLVECDKKKRKKYRQFSEKTIYKKKIKLQN